MHEVKSDSIEKTRGNLHEIESEIQKRVHEIKSEFFGTDPAMGLSERQNLHETESEFRKSLHETKSEVPKNLHETESELAEGVTRQMLEGLHQEKWVREG